MKEKHKIDWKVLVVAIVALVLLEAAAIYKGMNGIMFSAVIAAIALIAGVSIPTPFLKNK